MDSLSNIFIGSMRWKIREHSEKLERSREQGNIKREQGKIWKGARMKKCKGAGSKGRKCEGSREKGPPPNRASIKIGCKSLMTGPLCTHYADQNCSIDSNAYQYRSMPDQEYLIGIERYFGSMPGFWSAFDRLWSSSGIDQGSPVLLNCWLSWTEWWQNPIFFSRENYFFSKFATKWFRNMNMGWYFILSTNLSLTKISQI